MADPFTPHRVFAHNPHPFTGAGNNTWLLDGAEPTLVDAGTGEPAHIAELRSVLAGRALARVLVTHGHPDHASGVPALVALWPALEVRAFSGGGAVAGPHGLRGGEHLRAGDRDLLAIHTPGHAVDHLCFWDAASGDLYSGDMIVQGSTVMIPAGRGGDLRSYLASLEKLAALEPRRAFPGHGPVIDRPRETIAVSIDHRLKREAEVLACLRDGVTSADAIVARIYPQLSEALLPAARMTIDAHLDKLRQEGRA